MGAGGSYRVEEFADAHEAFASMEHLLEHSVHGSCKVYQCVIEDMSEESTTVPTELFPVPALEYYTARNIGDDFDISLRDRWATPERGGPQGDYRSGMREKIMNVVDCLRRFPESKRALITISNAPDASHEDDSNAKCLRELHFYICGGKLHCNGFMRAQALSIFPKNIHFIGAVMRRVAAQCGVGVGAYFHTVTHLVQDR